MSIPPPYTHPPNLAADANEVDRRLKILEFGDPNAVADARRDVVWITDQVNSIYQQLAAINQQITTLDQAIASLSGQLGVVHDSSNARDQTLYVNDSNIYTHLTNYSPPLRSWLNGSLANWITQTANWVVAYHIYAYHPPSGAAPGPGGYPGNSPGFPQSPAIPAWPVITDPNP